MTAHQQSLPLFSECYCGKTDCPIPYGLCHCGCGGKTNLYPYNNKTIGVVKGRPQLYVQGHSSITHGHTINNEWSREYVSWSGMIYRCTNSSCEFWYRYGGRGITVCERWMKFENFLADMGECPTGKSIDRIDNDGNYEPDNCKWSTLSEQALNREKKTHCKRGHELTDDNVYIDKRHGGRNCKICVLEKSKLREQTRPPRDWSAERAKRRDASSPERAK